MPNLTLTVVTLPCKEKRAEAIQLHFSLSSGGKNKATIMDAFDLQFYSV